ncbi:ribosome assembly RNA-binding protein YhbY [Iocasia frigidifontis]|uniref:Ribosome assembly RNA-binding protein YhbY n=1 Tax=Iocasia fonsfrigidae TaxID=2682810 RepID=A0A8A7KEF6_9FIRM|nr:ribosome assembly RNA-binding protein YhbY [Iocasia fonsfrigidae]QTL97277.1 ribosome assembly RNA-binding protein YhbY [Iocasia fonsfrigidae]
MLTAKQRSYLRGKANRLDPLLHIGKDGINKGLREQLDTLLFDHELVKGRVLDNSLEDVQGVAHKLAADCQAELVQVIGSVFVLYRENPEEPIYNLPG